MAVPNWPEPAAEAMNSRARAARIIAEVLDSGVSLDAALSAAGPPGNRDQAFVQELCYGVLRWLPRLRYQLGRLLDRPIRDTDRDVESLLLVGLYQILDLETPDHAAVAASVAACPDIGKPWTGNLVNAVLRRAVRERETLRDCIATSPAAEYALPKWLLKRLQRDWPDHWPDIARAGNQRPPLTVRVNTRRIDRQDYLQWLEQAGLSGEPHIHAPAGVIVQPALPAQHLPGFAEGLVSVQDAAAQLAAPVLDLLPGQRVLDACAAPGGKTAHILEYEPELAALIALDVSAERLQRVASGLERLGLAAELITTDARDSQHWWDGTPFDRILLDAPCSGSGVIRRHPDIKYHRDTAAVETAAGRQRELLEALWPLLAHGGKLLYATCSILPEENRDNIHTFLEQHPDATAEPVSAVWGLASGPGRQILPGESDMDGFFYALVRKH